MPIMFDPRPELTGLCLDKKNENKHVLEIRLELELAGIYWLGLWDLSVTLFKGTEAARILRLL